MTLPALTRDYVSTGKLLLAFNHFPLGNIHPFAFGAAEAAECAGAQSRFWPMHDAMFDDQQNLDGTSLLVKARSAKVELVPFAAYVENHATTAALEGRSRAVCTNARRGLSDV